jgi:acetyl esterase/lipase
VDLNRVAPELRPYVPKFRVPMESPFLRFLGHGVLLLLPGRTVPGVRFERRYDAGRGLCLFIPEVRTRDGALLWIHGGGMILGQPATDDRF